MGAVHASSHSEVAPIVAGLISQGLETATHITDSEEVQEQARDLPGDTYQATTAMTVKIGETDAVLDRRRPSRVLPRSGRITTRLSASMFLALGHIDHAHHVAASTDVAMQPIFTSQAESEVLSL